MDLNKILSDLLKKGYVPFCPWTDFHFHWFGDLTIEDYYRYSMGWLEVSDCIYVLRDSENSNGTQAEIKRARELKIPVLFESQDDLFDKIENGTPDEKNDAELELLGRVLYYEGD